MEHHQLVQEMSSIERMSTQDRLKLAKKHRSQQLKKFAQYEKQLEKGSKSKKKNSVTQQQQQQQQSVRKSKHRASDRVQFVGNIALLESAARNDIEEVRRLLNKRVSPDVTNEDGLTALHQCCIDNNEEMLKLLLEYGANVNACDSEMWTPLHAAATCGHVTLCKHLIERGAELLAVNADGNMPYDICEDDITLDYIESEMAKRGITQDQIDETRLATERQMLSDLKELLASGGDLNFRDAAGATMLHIASANGYIEVASFLLDQHVSIDAKDNESWQPIHAAAYWGQLDILEMLVQGGADLDSKTKNNETPFDLSEDPDIKQRILDMKDEIETKKALSRQRPGSSRKLKHNSRNTSIRRSSLRGERSSLFRKEAQEEAMHFGLRMMQDDEDLGILDEEKENMPATNIDDVKLTFDDHDSSSSSHMLPQGASFGKSGSKPKITPRMSTKPNVPEPPGSAANDPKKNRGDAREYLNRPPTRDTADDQFQRMFLETVPQINNNRNSSASVTSNSSSSHYQPHVPPMMDKRNGYNGNNSVVAPANPAANTTTTTTTPRGSFKDGRGSFKDGQLRKFVSPTSAPIVGADEKQKCCAIS